MKIVPLSKAKANLSRYGQLCRDEPVIVTVNGVPSFQLVALKKDENLVDQLIQHNPSFARMLKRRLREDTVSVSDARRLLRSRR